MKSQLAFLGLFGINSLVWGQGPIETRNHPAASLAFFRFEPRGQVLRTGQTALSASLTISNDLRLLPTVREDQETTRIAASFRKGEKWGEWAIEVPVLSRGGGILDPAIDWWHQHILGISNVRSQVAYGRSEIQYPGSGRFGSGSGLGDVSLLASREIGKGTSVSLGLKLPTGDASKLLGSGGTDFGVNFDHRLVLNPHFAVYGQLGYVWQGRPTRLANARGGVHQESLSFVVNPNSRDTWSLQWQGEASALQTGDSGSDSPHRMLTFGYGRKLNDRDRLQLFFSEDGDFLNFRVPELVNIAPDFTIGLRWTRKF